MPARDASAGVPEDHEVLGVAAGDDEVGLAVGVEVGGAVKNVMAIAVGIADGLARTHDGLQMQLEVAPGLGVSLHHGLERGGKQKRVRDAVLLHECESQLGAETPIPRHDGAAKVQRGQQGIHQTAGPRPIGGRPKHSGTACGQMRGV